MQHKMGDKTVVISKQKFNHSHSETISGILKTFPSYGRFPPSYYLTLIHIYS